MEKPTKGSFQEGNKVVNLALSFQSKYYFLVFLKATWTLYLMCEKERERERIAGKQRSLNWHIDQCHLFTLQRSVV